MKGVFVLTRRAPDLVIAFSCLCALSQQPSSPSFEVASVKRAAPLLTLVPYIERVDPGRVIYRAASWRFLLARAGRIKPYRVSGPPWLEDELYDISATLTQGEGEASIPDMLRTLLIERFKVEARFVQVPCPAYALVATKGGVKLKKVSTDDVQPAAKIKFTPGRLVVNGTTLRALADLLSGVLDRPVVDMTGVSGEYNLALDVTSDDPVARPAGGFLLQHQDDSTRVSLFTSLRDVGLRLERRELPIEKLIIDRIQKEPIEN